MYSTVAARKPGVFSKVGLHTYIDPRLEGGKMNAITTEDLVRVMVNHRILIERPILLHGDRAVIGRPPEKVEALLP